MNSAATLRNVAKNYGAKRALEDVSLVVPRSSILLVTGSNGAGKSTLLRVLTGIEPASSGSVEVFGRPPRYADARFRSLVAHVCARSRLYGWMTAESAAAFSRKMCSRWDARLCNRLLDDLRIERAVPFDRLSLGNQRKLAIAITFARDPELIALDEPLNGLDIESQSTLMGVVRERREGGERTCVIAGQPNELLTSTADAVVTLHYGGIAPCGRNTQV